MRKYQRDSQQTLREEDINSPYSNQPSLASRHSNEASIKPPRYSEFQRLLRNSSTYSSKGQTTSIKDFYLPHSSQTTENHQTGELELLVSRSGKTMQLSIKGFTTSQLQKVIDQLQMRQLRPL